MQFRQTSLRAPGGVALRRRKSAPFCASTLLGSPATGATSHHLLELCGLVEARVADLDGADHPCRPNDRLLLGMNGGISEFEIGMLRARMFDAARAKALG